MVVALKINPFNLINVDYFNMGVGLHCTCTQAPSENTSWNLSNFCAGLPGRLPMLLLLVSFLIFLSGDKDGVLSKQPKWRAVVLTAVLEGGSVRQSPCNIYQLLSSSRSRGGRTKRGRCWSQGFEDSVVVVGGERGIKGQMIRQE